MRVRLSYSVEMDDVPPEISDLIQKRIKELHDALDLVEDSSARLRENGADLQMIADSIDRARLKMSKFDQTLGDAHDILQGYIGALQAPPTPAPEEAPLEEQPSPWPPENLDV